MDETVRYSIKVTNWVSGVVFYSESRLSVQDIIQSIIDPTEIIVRKHMSEAFWLSVDEWNKYKDRTVTVSARRKGKETAEYCTWYYFLDNDWRYMIVPAYNASLYSPRIPAVAFAEKGIESLLWGEE